MRNALPLKETFARDMIHTLGKDRYVRTYLAMCIESRVLAMYIVESLAYIPISVSLSYKSFVLPLADCYICMYVV